MYKRYGCLFVIILCPIIALLAAGLASPLVFMALGDRAMASLDYAEAETAYGRAAALALLPGVEPRALWGRGQARLKQDDWDASIADYTAVLAAEPDQSEAYAQRGYAHLQLKQYKQAIGDLSSYLAAVPNQSEALGERGYAHLQLKQYEDAIADLSAYLAAEPANADVQAQRGTAELQLDRLDAAIADLQRAVDLKTSNQTADRASLAEAYFRHAKISAGAGAFNETVADLSLALQADATREEIHTLRGYANLQLGQFDDSIGDTTTAIGLNADAFEAYAYRAAAGAGRGQWKTAAADATTALGSAGLQKRERGLALFARALAGAAQGQFDRSIADTTDALALGTLDAPRVLTLTLVRAAGHLERDEYASAVTDYDAALSMSPPIGAKATIYAGRGWARLAQSQWAAAASDFNLAIVLTPDDPWLYQHRGLAYAETRDYTLALADDNRALELDPRRPIALTNRGEVYAALQQYDKAIADFEKALSLNDDPAQTDLLRSYVLLSQAAIHAQQADQAAKDFEALMGKGTTKGADAVQRFQQNFLAARERLQTMQAELDQTAKQYGEVEKLKLPDWYVSYATKSRQSLEREREGFALVEQLWNRTNTLVSSLPQLADQLDKAASSGALSSESLKQYSQFLQNRDFAGARALTASARASLQQYHDYFQKAQTESGLGFVGDAVQFFGKQVDYTNNMDELTAAVEARDQARFDKVVAQMTAQENDLKVLAGRMANWDAQMNRWWQTNLQPLADAADAKFKEADGLGKEAAALFDEGRQKVIVPQHRSNLPPGVKS